MIPVLILSSHQTGIKQNTAILQTWTQTHCFGGVLIRGENIMSKGGFVVNRVWNYVLFVSIIERDRDKIRILISIVFCSEGVLFSWAAKSDSFTVFQICWSGLLH